MVWRKWVVIVLAVTSSALAYAEGDALSSDTEDLTNEADAAAGEVTEVKQQLQSENREAKKRHQAATKLFNSAAAKRAQTVDQMQRQEAEIFKLEADQVKLKAETERMSAEAAATAKVVQEARLRSEKLKRENRELEVMRGEKAAEVARIAAERDKLSIDLREIEDKQRTAEAAFQRLKEQETVERRELDRVTLEHAQKSALLATAQADRSSLEATRKPSAMSATVMKTCRIFDGPVKGSNVLGLQEMGTSIAKSKEGKSWVAFTMSNGQLGYIAKSCLSR